MAALDVVLLNRKEGSRMRYVRQVFRATPCNEEHPQLFEAWYEEEDFRDGLIACRLVPGSLKRLTALQIVDVVLPEPSRAEAPATAVVPAPALAP